MKSINFIFQSRIMENPFERTPRELGFYNGIHKNGSFVLLHVTTYPSWSMIFLTDHFC